MDPLPCPTSRRKRSVAVRTALPLPLALALAIVCLGCAPSRPSGPSSAPPESASAHVSQSGASVAPGTGSPRLTGSPGASGPFDPATVSVSLEPFVDGLTAPLAIVNAMDGSNRLFVVEQGGRIRLIRDGQLVDGPVLDIGDEISSGGERGLLGLAF